LHTSPLAHFLAQPPQFETSFWVSAQVPLQSVCPDGQLQRPAMQVLPPVHLMSQSPQFELSEPVLRQTPLQSLSGSGPHGVAVHLLAWQVSPAAHLVPHAPQFEASTLVSMHLPLQSVSPPAQLHLPPMQVKPAAASHFWPQAPQFALSLCGSMQEPLQLSLGAGQSPHFPLLHDWPAWHAVPQAPQFCGSEVSSTHLGGVPQAVSPPTQAQLPATQLMPAAVSHFWPQAPQFALSLCGSMQEPLHASLGAAQP
jgi:hypothetical protein